MRIFKRKLLFLPLILALSSGIAFSAAPCGDTNGDGVVACKHKESPRLIP